MTAKEFEAICSLVTSQSGIKLGRGKEALVSARLGKRIRSLEMSSIGEYLNYLEHDRGHEVSRLLDAITTNVTSFFREPNHFEFLRNQILPRLVTSARSQKRYIRIWSAGCSSGEEPYSIAIHLCEGLPNLEAWDVRILATDLSTSILERARAGVYTSEQIEDIPRVLRQRYFESGGRSSTDEFRVCDRIRRLVTFAPLNLMSPWPIKGPFDVIFCRNVMIYFDKPTQNRLVQRFRQLLRPAGTLFIGHSESLGNARQGFEHIRNTIYERC